MYQSATFLRAPFTNTDLEFNEELKIISSNNKEYDMVISHEWKYKKGLSTFLFALVDKRQSIIENFEPHTTDGNVIWSADDRVVAVSIGIGKLGYLIVDVEKHLFALINFKKRPPARVENSGQHLIFKMPPELINTLNSDKLIGGGRTELPRIKYEKPQDLIIDLGNLSYYKKADLPDIINLEKDSITYQFEPLKNGFWPFKGELPKNTVDGYNGRPFEMYQLETFVEYGDEQSRIWLEMVIEQTNGKYQLYQPVFDYIGRKERIISPDPSLN